MFLIDTLSLELREFSGRDLPKYAILSHRWGEEEPNHKNFRKKRQTHLAGYQKIVDCCDFVRARGHAWLWVDTVCIDKKSSAELSEAINSMYQWYQNASECYAYLEDLAPEHCYGSAEEALQRSAWFTRGWTLQEMLAPMRLTIVNRDWIICGRTYPDEDGLPRVPANDRSIWHYDEMLHALSALTSVPVRILNHQRSVYTESVATRMSWMGRRCTTRVEDQAYCMLGLFRINMPLLYGEGNNAFRRLQKEIVQDSSDETIFMAHSSRFINGGILNTKPSAYEHGSCVRRAHLFDRPPYTFTNRGLRLEFLPGSMVFAEPGSTKKLLIALNCRVDSPAAPSLAFLYLTQMSCGHYAREVVKMHQIEQMLGEAQIMRWKQTADAQWSPRSGTLQKRSQHSVDMKEIVTPVTVYVHWRADDMMLCRNPIAVYTKPGSW